MNAISSHNFYLLRRPLLPSTLLNDFHKECQTNHNIDHLLRNIFSDPILQEAIYISSPAFFKPFINWLKSNNTDSKISSTLYKYFIRMCTRCTPYGLFAGCSTGLISDKTEIVFNQKEPYLKRSRLDMAYLLELIHHLGTCPELSSKLIYTPNNSIYKVDNKYRYTEARFENEQYTYYINSIEASVEINDIIRKATTGLTLQNLIDELVVDDISYEEASDFINELIDSQLLVSELQPTITGEEWLNLLIDKLRRADNTADHVKKFSLVQELLQKQDSSIEKYVQIEQIINTISQVQVKNLVQVDLFYPTEVNSISQKIVDRIVKEVNHLLPLMSKTVLPDLEEFKKRCYARYEEQEIPLLVALDDELGVGYGSGKNNVGYQPLTEGVDLSITSPSKTLVWSQKQEFILQKYFSTIEQHQTRIELSNQDLDVLSTTCFEDHYPNSFYVLGNILGSSAEAIDKGDFTFNMLSCAGPSGASLLGRFCHGDHLLNQQVINVIQEEERKNPDVVFAEIVHLSEARAGNILKRPVLRNYEIPYLCSSTLEQDFQLPLDDLQVSVSGGKKVKLRSKKLNKEVIPRLTSAHNFTTGLPIYRFLCDLQFQDKSMNLHWDWGVLSKEKFLPRVQYKNIIISRATWLLTKQKVENDLSSLSSFRQAINKEYNIPSCISIIEGDNELLIDTRVDFSLCVLREEILKKGSVTVKEYIFSSDSQFINHEDKYYTNEVIIPLQRPDSTSRSAAHANKQASKKESATQQIVRSFSLGSEWLYVKIYAGEKTLENLLVQTINPLVKQLVDDKLIDKWFYVRYADPESHIRIRFHGCNDTGFYTKVIDQINFVLKEKIQQHIINRVQYDTYAREIERYGESIIHLCEDVFFFDSNAVLNIISLLNGDDNENHRWLLAMKGVDFLLTDFGYTLAEKLSIIELLQKSFAEEFNEIDQLSTQLNNKYRKYAKVINAELTLVGNNSVLSEGLTNPLLIRSTQLKSVVEQIKERTEANKLNSLVADILHMYMNRLFFVNHRFHELVIYHFLAKYYKTLYLSTK